MGDKTKVLGIVENIVKEFPGLRLDPQGDGVEIRAEDDLVGNYTFEAVENGGISEQDIREDCEAFFATKKGN